MNNRKFMDRLAEMKGKTFQYAKQIHCVINYRIDSANERCFIDTNIKTFDRDFAAMDEFLNYWTPAVSIENAVLENTLIAYEEKEVSMADSLIALLQDNIEKVKQNKEYIPQATSINNNVNSIIAIQKMKMEFLKSGSRKKFR